MPTVRSGRAALVVAALVIAGCGGVGVSRAPGDPSPEPVVAPSPAPTSATTPAPSPSKAAPSPAVDDVLPPPDGASHTATRTGRDDRVREVTEVYRVPASVDTVRAHYREVLRSGGWTLTGVETEGGEWELDARHGRREVEVELRPAGDETIVEVTVSDPAAP
jgi:hypothetical protein